MKLILASGSPRRRELLETMGLREFTVVKPDFDEDAVTAPSPAALVETLSAGKARAAAQAVGDADALILAADTVVALDGEILGKPADEAEACRMLRALSGREHAVYTGFTLLQGASMLTGHEETIVRFRTLSEEEITAYVSTGEPMDKAGSYGIQGLASLFVEGIRGDYFNVMGLPVCRLGQELARFGVTFFNAPETP